MIRVESLTVRLGEFQLADVHFEVPTGEYAVLMGQTGTGKTTIIECLCGLRPIQTGRIWLGRQEVTRLPPSRRGIGYVPQDGALFGHLTVREHLAFPLRIRRRAKSEIESRTATLAQLLNLEHLLDRRPQWLSGGEMQRVALGRAMSFEPEVLLLDEPLSALDDETRNQMVEVLLRIRQLGTVTALHITHNADEGKRLADRSFRLNRGVVACEAVPAIVES
ncbi:MAG: ATP-binding cassette domain-containing protein [Pirellulales bacterium]|nr:ATP-binding cassette domain-containing protein [Pirellulales bacterium]